MLQINLKTFSRFATPLIFSAMAGHVMLFCDRLILAKYNIEAMNAATMIGNFCATFQFGLIGVASIAEVFVGQYNGAQQNDKVRTPVWQMVWLSLFSFLITIPVTIFGIPLAIDSAYVEIGSKYYYWVMGSAPILSVSVAFSSFFIGRGKAFVVTSIAVISNIINLILDIILVFGIEGIIPAYGMEGAAIATVISQFANVFMLLGVFLRKKYRNLYQTHKPDWNWQIMKECWNIGAPNAVAHVLEIIGWTVSMRIIAFKGPEYLTVSSVGQTIFFLAAFFNDGLNKATSALAANCIGAKLWDKIIEVLKSAFVFHTFIMVAVSLVLVVYPEYLIDYFVQDSDPETYRQIKFTLFWVWLFAIFDGITWIIAGVLTSGGDTKFIMVVGSISSWLIGVLPVYFVLEFIVNPPAHYVWGVSVVYAVMLSMIYALRYASGKWKKLILT